MAKFISFKHGIGEEILNLDSIHRVTTYMTQSYQEDEITPDGEPYRVVRIYYGPAEGDFGEGGGEFLTDFIQLRGDVAETVWAYLKSNADVINT